MFPNLQGLIPAWKLERVRSSVATIAVVNGRGKQVYDTTNAWQVRDLYLHHSDRKKKKNHLEIGLRPFDWPRGRDGW